MIKNLVFMFIGALNKCNNRIRRSYFQFYNLQYLRWKGAKIGRNVRMEGKTAITIADGGHLEIGDNFICRSGFRGHILGGEYSSFHIVGGGKNWKQFRY